MSRTLTVYLRTGCHLCEDMLMQLEELQAAQDFVLNRVDINDNSELEASYGTKVPVLVADGQEICHYYLDKVALTRYFEGG